MAQYGAAVAAHAAAVAAAVAKLPRPAEPAPAVHAPPPDAEAVPPHVARLRASLRETLDASPVWSWESLVRTGLAREA